MTCLQKRDAAEDTAVTWALAVVVWLSISVIPTAAGSPSPGKTVWELSVQRRGDDGHPRRETIALNPAGTAIVVIDMWDRHWCKTYTARVANLVPRMNQTLDAARKLGVQVVFAPSDVLKPYQAHPQRKAMQAIPEHPVPKQVDFAPPRTPGPTDGCECGPDQPCKQNSYGHWSRQHSDLRIAEGDLIGDCNNGRELLNLCSERSIDTLIYMGVARPAFAHNYLDKEFRSTFCFAKGAEGADRNDVPGLETLDDADLLVLSMRRRALPVVQMDHLEGYIRAGKPIVAIRVSVVPFQVRDTIPPGHVVWDRFDKQVLGCNYSGYDGGARQHGGQVWVLPEATDHPILKEVKPMRWQTPCWIYKQRPLSETATPLLEGRWSDDVPTEPVAWTNTYRGARVFYTTLGHQDDFNMEPFNRLLLGGIRWAIEN